MSHMRSLWIQVTGYHAVLLDSYQSFQCIILTHRTIGDDSFVRQRYHKAEQYKQESEKSAIYL